jgi:hypothetical protein
MQVLSVVDRWFERRSGKPRHYVIGMCWFSAKHAALKEKKQKLVGSNQDNVSESGGMDIRGLLFL